MTRRLRKMRMARSWLRSCKSRRTNIRYMQTFALYTWVKTYRSIK